MNKKVSLNSYKGVRDFYPKDWRFQKWLFEKMSDSAELFGYEQYNASPLEYQNLYTEKSGKEILGECYNFQDKGEREITLRPEMTPTLARMIAAKQRDLVKPIRWYSIPNVFRYEKMQKGRLREHYQLNVDIFGLSGIEAEIEILEIGFNLCQKIGLSQKDFKIKINNRKILKDIFEIFTNDEKKIYDISKILDKKNKLSKKDFEESIEKILKKDTKKFLEILNTKNFSDLEKYCKKENLEKIEKIIEILDTKNIKNVEFDLNLMRGFDYYTDIVFEFFDTHPENNRSMFGGGRYDDLLDIFGKEKMPAVGFGMGDVTAKNALEIRNIIPEISSKTKISILPFSKDFFKTAEDLADFLRKNNINTDIDYSEKKIEKKIKNVEKKNIDFFCIVGDFEESKKKFSVKNISTKKIYKNIKAKKILKILS